ncbi:hypothetical protein QR680_003546 [Steinernema hermaphroditum]|uniref:Peptidase M14 domain-containing protein n=1 Tax=Steinernema hermaphroditum TaxID=289476 RepID=A0AA39HLS5_9BILA|nr:hypothetical protein QR680_003546 [Steinernema hermaphroditum]
MVIVPLSQHASGGPSSSFHYRHLKFNAFEEIEEYLRIAADENPERVKLLQIGRSHENRSLTVLQIGHEGPALWIDAGIHAREWISVAVALKFIDQLVKHGGPNVTFYIMPVVNPDGYSYSMTKERFWRKNRKAPQCGDSSECCQGVDLNRNFDSNFKSSPGPCSDIHPGAFPFSEPETRAIRDFLTHRNLKLFLTLHSYGQMLLLPRDIPFDHPTRLLALRASSVLKAVHGSEYVVGTSKEVFNSSSGGLAKDWAYEKLGVQYSYTIELRPESPREEFSKICGTNLQCGFLVNPKEIEGTFEETWEAVQVMVKQIVFESY